MSARVFLGETLVGELRPQHETGGASFEFDATYASAAKRPILGRWFEDQLIDPPRTFEGKPLPNFFLNLLPEGALRKIVKRRIGKSALPDDTMLLRLGEDLPGTVDARRPGSSPESCRFLRRRSLPTPAQRRSVDFVAKEFGVRRL